MNVEKKYINEIKKEFFNCHERKYRRSFFKWLLIFVVAGVVIGYLPTVDMRITLIIIVIMLGYAILWFKKQINCIRKMLFYKVRMDITDKRHLMSFPDSMKNAFSRIGKLREKDYYPSKLERCLWELNVDVPAGAFFSILYDILEDIPLHFSSKRDNRHGYKTLLIVSEEGRKAVFIAEPDSFYGIEDSEDNYQNHGYFKEYKIVTYDGFGDHEVNCFWYDGMISDIMAAVESSEHQNITFERKTYPERK